MVWLQRVIVINTDKHYHCYNVAVSWQWPHMFGVRSLVFDFSPPNLSISLSLSLDATAVITPTKEHKDMSGLERFEPLLEGVHLTTNLLHDPVGPSGHSCPPQLQLRRHKDRWSLDRF